MSGPAGNRISIRLRLLGHARGSDDTGLLAGASPRRFGQMARLPACATH